MKKAYLVLADGHAFEGVRFGAEGETLGEMVFTTNMCGYLETLTDPSYAGQIVMQTFPLIGNYGVMEADFEGGCFVKGYVVRELCDAPSNFRSQGALDAFLKKQGVVTLAGVDTRGVAQIIREKGVMNAIITDAIPENLDFVQAYSVQGVVGEVSCREMQVYPANGAQKKRVALMDYGAKKNIIRELQKRGCEVTVYPQDTPAKEILSGGYDGVMLSNGPGDPAENVYCISQIREMMGQIPVFGICLGHQLMALAAGGTTEKLKYGHRGANQPVKDVAGTRTYITTQNHGYVVNAKSIEGKGVLRYINANDGSPEGIDYDDMRAFSVQFHPEACAGPHDTSFLFDRFMHLMGGETNAT